MPEYVTAEGFIKRRQDQIKADLEAAFRTIYGVDVQLSPESTNGQKVGVWSEGLADTWDMLQAVYDSFHVDGVAGTVQDLLYQLNRLVRKQDSPSVATLVFDGEIGYLIPAGFEVTNVSGSLTFATDEDLTLDGVGFGEVEASATINGNFEAPSDTLTVQVAPDPNIFSVTNPNAAIPGRYKETDSEFRLRHSLSTSLPALNLLESVYSGMMNLEGVEDVRVYQNRTRFDDSNGLPPHSWMPIVQGGSSYDIAGVIFKNSPAGIASVGDVEAVWQSDEYPDLSTPVYFQRPEFDRIEVDMQLLVSAQFPADGIDIIKQNILDYVSGKLLSSTEFVGFGIGRDITMSRLIVPVNLVQGHDIDFIRARIYPSTEWLDNRVPILFDHKGGFAAEDIYITTVPYMESI